jgi:hypothetical protein
MAIKELENLVGTGQLQREPPAQQEMEVLVSSGARRLKDAENASLAIESRFDLAYNAAHALALAGLRSRGYRSNNRYIVFQCLPHTLGVAKELVRILDSAHKKRNNSEYDGVFDVDLKFVEAVIRSTQTVHVALLALMKAQEQ